MNFDLIMAMRGSASEEERVAVLLKALKRHGEQALVRGYMDKHIPDTRANLDVDMAQEMDYASNSEDAVNILLTTLKLLGMHELVRGYIKHERG